MQGIGSQYDLIHLTFKFNIPSVFKNIKFDESKIDSSFFIYHTDKFISDSYFLTQQQLEFKKDILKKPARFIILRGLPGTGKTLLLYDLAKELKKMK